MPNGATSSDVEAVRAFIESRRLHHTWPRLASGCCVNCDRKLKDEARCLRCGEPFHGDVVRCPDVEADAALVALDVIAYEHEREATTHVARR